MNIALVSMSKINEKFPRLEHCCEGLCEKIVFHPEINLVLANLKNKKVNAEFYDGSILDEKDILEKLDKNKPKKIIYYLNTPYIRKKEKFMKKLSEIGELSLVIVPFFWKEKILKEFPFVKDVFFDGEKALGLNVSKTKINYDSLDLSRYLNRNYAFPVIFSKYCPYSCTYCVAQKTGLMERDLKIVKEEIEELKKKGFDKFVLMGNNLTINKDNFIELCNFMKRLNVEWSGDGRVNHMEKEMYDALENSRGTLLFGIESANQEILNKIKKDITIEQIVKNSDELKKRNIPFRYTFMFGFPDDSEKTAQEMIELKKRVGALNYHCLYLSPLPGTQLFNEMVKLNLICEKNLDFENFSNPYNSPVSGTLNLTKERVGELGKKIMVKSISNWSVLKHIIKTKKIREYPAIIKKAVKLIFFGKRD